MHAQLKDLEWKSIINSWLDKGGQHEQGEDALQPNYLHLVAIHGRHALLGETFHRNLRKMLIMLKTICIFLTLIIFSPTMPHLHAPIVAEGNLIVLMHHPDKLPGQGFPGTGGVLASLTSYRVVSWVASGRSSESCSCFYTATAPSQASA